MLTAITGNARIAEMEEDLKLKGLEYNTAASVFFVSYAFFEGMSSQPLAWRPRHETMILTSFGVPSNIVLTLIRPSIWIALLMFCWGTVMRLMGIVSTVRGLYAA
jgi:hypothetical protein